MKKYLKLLQKFVAIPSVSASIGYKSKIEECAKFIEKFCVANTMKVEIVRGYGNPIIIAKTPQNPKLETILVYGHYDVQPANKEDGWIGDPFRLNNIKGKLIGRGSADNKGQILIHLLAVADLIKTKSLGYNVTFLIEGNEETGSPDLGRFVRKYSKDLACDCIVISDGELSDNLSPVLEKSFRGVANMEISLTTAPDDLHSGLYGGLANNAAEEMAKIIAKFHGPKRKILVPNFYIGTKPKEVSTNPTGLGPAIEITGFTSGYNGDGFRNSIPCRSNAKINIRSGPNQNPKDLALSLKKFILANKPKFAQIKFGQVEIASSASFELKNKYAKKAEKILEEVYGKKVIYKSSGGTLPIVNDFAQIIKAPQVMIPLADQDCGAHSASEFISLKAIKKGLVFSARFFGKY